MFDNPRPETRNLTDPMPRRVDIFTKATILFGGFSQQFGWAFFAFGSIFAWIFVPLSEARFWLESKKGWVEIPGEVLSLEPTNSSVNDQIVYRYAHAFEWNGRQYIGNSYAVGSMYQIGDQVTVRFRENTPEYSHIKGARRAVFPAFVLFVLLFPIVGLVFIISSLRQNLKAISLLENGAFTRGTMKSKDSTNSSIKINNTTYPIYKYSFEFSAGGKTHVATCRTHQVWKVEDEEQEIILYDPFNPARNVVFDAAPNMPAITARGELTPASLWKAGYLILPLLGIALNFYFMRIGTLLGLN